MKYIPTVLIASLLTLSTCVFSQTGKIKGKVTDKSTNETMVGVALQLNDSAVTASDIEGRFTFMNLRAGLYTIKVISLGYETRIVREVKVSDESVTTVNIVLEASAGDSIPTVEIVGTLNRQEASGYYLDQKNGAGLSDGIPAGVISKSPDRTGSDVLKRVSGASIQDGKFVTIRGLSDRYNTAMINGMLLPSTEPDRKAFSFDLFPAAMLDNMTVYKTATPDLPGDFAGGVIQLRTRDIPDSTSFSFSAGTGYNSQSTFKEYLTYDTGKKTWLGIDDGTMGLPDSIPTTKVLKGLLLDPETRYAYSHILSNDWKIESERSAPLSQSYQLAFGTQAKLFKHDLGVVGAITYNNSRKTVITDRADFNIMPDTSRLFQYRDEQFKHNVQWGGIVNLAYKLNENNKISVKNLYSITGEDQVIKRTGSELANLNAYVLAASMQFTSNKLTSSQVSGEHFLPSGKIKLKWSGAYNSVDRDMPNLRRMYYTKNIEPQGNATDTTWTAYVPYGQPSPNYAGKFYSKLHETIYTGTADVTIPVKLFGKETSIKTGVMALVKDRKFDARVFGYVIASTQFDYNLYYASQDTIFDHDHIGPKGFRLSEATSPSDNYLAGSELYSGYAMLDQLIGKRLRAVYGLRIESFRQELDAMTYSNDSISIDTTYIDYLPSLNLTWKLNDLSNLRFAASRTTARPELRELAPFSFYDFSTSASVYGNDTLVRTSITNLDARYEIYPGFGQVLSATVFYKDFKDPIEQVVDASSGFGSRTYTYQNALRATNYGIEVEFRTKLNKLDSIGLRWKQWDNFTLFANAAMIHSRIDASNVRTALTEAERPLQGQSPYIINCGLSFNEQNKGLGATVLFNRIGRRIWQVGSNGYKNIYEAPRSLIDLQLTKRILKNGEVKLNVSDLLNQSSVFYQDQDDSGKYEEGKDSRLVNTKYGTNYSVSFSYKF